MTAVHAPVSDAIPGTMAELNGLEPLSETLTQEYLEYYGVLPLSLTDENVVVATWLDDVDVQAIDDLRLLFQREIQWALHAEPDVRRAIRRTYGSQRQTASGVIADLRSEEGDRGSIEIPLDDLVSLANEAPVVKLVNLLLLEALDAGASDVHLEAYAERLRVRYRLDGVLQDAPSPPDTLKPAIVSRLKIMADLDVAERRVPQDGRIHLRLQDRQVDVRVSTLPTLGGESVVLRLLDKDRGRIALEDLGMGEDTRRAFEEAISRPHGIVLATGPTGSGKTTTLYAAVEHIRTGREKIVTVEDPVEYELDGVPQVPVNEKVGVTFAIALRAMLRQDPDILLVGEIRDEETAEIATQAALTGHLVLSTLHTNDAAGSLTRLLDLSVAPYLVASTVEAVLAQRLVRKICPHCSEDVSADPATLRALGLDGELDCVRQGQGCRHCRGTGFRGRTGIYELLALDDDIRQEIQRRPGTAEIRRIAIAKGMRVLLQDGARLVLAGVTTPAEVLRTTST